MSLLKLDNVNAYYGGAHILYNVTIEVPESRAISLLGRNGMGKSTILKTIMGFTKVPEGVIQFDHRDITRKRTDEIARAGIGYVPEDRRIFATMSVKENLLVSYITGKTSIKSKLEEVFALFPVLLSKCNLRGDQLSGGELQMLAIGRVLMNDPKLILIDEPCEGLAPVIVRELEKSVKDLLNSGATILLAEQSVRIARTVSDYSYVLSRGSVCYEGKVSDLFSDSLKMKQYLGISR